MLCTINVNFILIACIMTVNFGFCCCKCCRYVGNLLCINLNTILIFERLTYHSRLVSLVVLDSGSVCELKLRLN